MRAILPLLIALVAVPPACKSTADLPPSASPAEILAEGKTRMSAGEYRPARDLFERIVDDHSTSREAGEAQWLMAEMSFRLEEWTQAKKDYITFHETHPLGYLGELEERMYEIAVQLYHSGQRGVLGLGLLASSGRAYDAFDFIIEKLDRGSRADDALLFMGKARILDDKFEEAADHFERLLEDYPESEWALSARFYRGWAYRLVNRGAPYDLRSLLNARDAFRDYIQVIEKDPARRTEYAEQVEEARTNLAEVQATLAEKHLYIARYYLSIERPESARWYLESTTRDHPDTEAATEAREILGDEK